MSTILWSARWSTAKGYHWKHEGERGEEANDWLAYFQKDEPEVLFVLSDKMPSKKLLAKLERPLCK
jgi:hypothetical protein